MTFPQSHMPAHAGYFFKEVNKKVALWECTWDLEACERNSRVARAAATFAQKYRSYCDVGNTDVRVFVISEPQISDAISCDIRTPDIDSDIRGMML